MLVFRLSSKAEYCKTILHLKGYQSQAKDCYMQMITTHKGADFDAAAYLLQQGADLSVLSSFLKPAYGENQRKVLTRMLQSAKKTRLGSYQISFNQVNIDGYVNNLAVGVGMYREILNVDVAFGIFVHKERGNIIVIGRSGTNGLNVEKIMHDMGGGGHSALIIIRRNIRSIKTCSSVFANFKKEVKRWKETTI